MNFGIAKHIFGEKGGKMIEGSLFPPNKLPLKVVSSEQFKGDYFSQIFPVTAPIHMGLCGTNDMAHIKCCLEDKPYRQSHMTLVYPYLMNADCTSQPLYLMLLPLPILDDG